MQCMLKAQCVPRAVSLNVMFPINHPSLSSGSDVLLPIKIIWPLTGCVRHLSVLSSVLF